uniref:Uncharacterized protein n=1 Tax=Noccaea caerulescens TaxID=107243 RepID=A0A1J3JSC2_NOCCA
MDASHSKMGAGDLAVFPCHIPFWIRVHDMPLHYYKPDILKTIGSELGTFIDLDVREGWVKVQINALKPPTVRKPVCFPTCEESYVELEYENLEKHYFICLALSHERDDCPKAESNLPLPHGSSSSRRELRELPYSGSTTKHRSRTPPRRSGYHYYNKSPESNYDSHQRPMDNSNPYWEPRHNSDKHPDK